MRIYSLLLLPLLFLTSCATITRGVHEKLRIESDPGGANVVLSTGEKSITPATFIEKPPPRFVHGDSQQARLCCSDGDDEK